MSIKIFVSDLHLSDATTGNYNINKEVLDNFFNYIKGDIASAGGKAELIILGDFLDILRSTRWKDEIQPWINPNSIKSTVVDIVNSIFDKNVFFFSRLKEYTYKNIDITYIMGNHDRLLNSSRYDDIREVVRELLGIKYSNGDIFDWKYDQKNLLIYAEHGNNCDIYNSICSKGMISIGDAIITLLINKYPESIYKIKKDEVTYKRLQEIDNLRPVTIAPLWIRFIENDNENLIDFLEEQWDTLLSSFKENEFVKEWGSKNKIQKFKLDVCLRLFTNIIAEKGFEKFSGLFRKQDPYLTAAVTIADSGNYDYVLFGHTHECTTSLLDVKDGKKKYYINTGTWRKRIVHSKIKDKVVFGDQESINYALLTIDDDTNEVTGFQVWDGILG